MQSASSFLGPIRGILSIISIVGLWKILEDRGEGGWKSLIPYYNTITFGKTCEEKPRAIRLVIDSIIILVSFLGILFFGLSIMLAAGVEFTEDASGKPTVIVPPDFKAAVAAANIPEGVFVILGIFTIIFLLFALFHFINYIKLHRAFDRYNGGNSAMILAWLFLPVFAYVYYAFMHKREMIEEPVVDGEL